MVPIQLKNILCGDSEYEHKVLKSKMIYKKKQTNVTMQTLGKPGV